MLAYIAWNGIICGNQLRVVYSVFNEVTFVIVFLIQTNDSFYSKYLKDWNIIFRCKCSILKLNRKSICLRYRIFILLHTPFEAYFLSRGVEWTINLFGIIQFQSPFSKCEQNSYLVRLNVFKSNHFNLTACSRPRRQSKTLFNNKKIINTF